MRIFIPTIMVIGLIIMFYFWLPYWNTIPMDRRLVFLIGMVAGAILLYLSQWVLDCMFPDDENEAVIQEIQQRQVDDARQPKGQ